VFVVAMTIPVGAMTIPVVAMLNAHRGPVIRFPPTVICAANQ
jgi:hypothetical protein